MINVFVSYSWGIEDTTSIVEEVALQGKCRKIRVVRDCNEMKHGDLIVDFMDKLTGAEHIITVFSKPYFTSKWCMFELLKIWQKGDFNKRTHPIIADDCDLQDADYRFEMIDYWVNEHETLKTKLVGRDPTLQIEEFKKLNLLRDISQNINELMNFAAGRLTTPLADLQGQDYAQLLDQISLIPPSYLHKIKANIKQSLTGESVDVFRGVLVVELNKVVAIDGTASLSNDPAIIADTLVELLRTGGATCPAINKVLQNTASRCLDATHNNYKSVEPNKAAVLGVIERILGNLVLSLVDENDAEDLSEWLRYDLADLYFELHASTLGGVEIFISHYQQRQANLSLDGRKVSGRNLIYDDSTTMSHDLGERMSDIQRLIWNTVFDDDKQTALTKHEVDELEAELITLRELEDDESNYCVAIPFEQSQDEAYRKVCEEFLTKLKIPLVHFNLNSGTDAFHGIERNLMSAVRNFLIKINKIA